MNVFTKTRRDVGDIRLSEQEFVWTQAHGDRYRASYDNLTFTDKQYIQNYILSQYQQLPGKPDYLLKCLDRIGQGDLIIVELGGYDGTHASHVLAEWPDMIWHNYDFSVIAQRFTYPVHPSLRDANYWFELLNHPFIKTPLPAYANLFYTSKTLEHFRWREIEQIIQHTKNIRYQVHVIDWFWRDDTHVVEQNCHQELVRLLKNMHYRIRDEYIHPERSHVFAELIQ